MGASAGGSGPHLVMGASGFLGSHVTRQLVERGDEVRVWTRPSSSTRAFDDLAVDHHRGELDDAAALAEALRGVDTVHYCIVDTRAWLHDPAPLFATNVDALGPVIDAALAAEVRRFVFCSTVGTIGIPEHGPADETDVHNWVDRGGAYIRSRLEAEELVLAAARERGLPAVALCVSTTYGAPDFGSPHGRMVADAALGTVPAYFANAAMEVVGVGDAARAFLLAAEHGRVGERYIVSDRTMSWKELVTTAAEAVDRPPPRFGIPLTVMKGVGLAGDGIARVLRRDVPMTSVTVRLMHVMPPLDHAKATRELGWEPEPTEEAIRAAARWYVDEARRSAAS